MQLNWFKQFVIFLSIKCCAVYAVIGYSNHAGKFSHDLHTANLIIPRKVDENGKHLSNNVSHYHDDDKDTKLYYHIDLHDETMHIEVKPVNDFIAPLMVIERHRRDTRSRKKHPRNKNRCHYQGRVRNDENSNVAISACDGIAGMIQTRKGDYYIEPSKHHSLNETGHPHVIFQRTSLKLNNHNDNQVIKRRRKRRKGRKKYSASNCGTKEPKRSTETQIEWQPQGKIIIQGSRRTHNQHRRKFSIYNQRRRDRERRRQHQLHKWQQKHKKQQIENEDEIYLRLHHQKKPYSHNKYNHQQDYNVTSGDVAENKTNSKTRPKRSVSSPRHVEALVVADPSMVSFHQDGDVETYLLTIMNMVSSLYKDPAIGNLIQVVVVRIVLLEEDDSHPEFNVTHAAEGNLKDFCRWQRRENPKDEDDPHHHDVAILITRKDICSASGCTTLGVANVGGMCRPDRSCSVNEDNGITLAHTITHELGHNFGMYHDTEKTGCDSRAGSIVHVMTPSFEADTIQVSWSNCSRRDITHFLDQGLGKCLDDEPTEEEFTYPDLPPGAMYNADLQCHLQFNTTDETVKVCSKTEEICSQLWCLVDDTCVTQLRPAAPGTNCGHHKWCQNQKCTAIEELPAPVDGGWGNWNEWSNCSRSCGGGVSIQSRQCDNPVPENGGTFCVGERIRYKICNIETCPENEPTFRATQCSKYNNESYHGKMYNWLPYFDSHDPCELYCTDSEETLIVPWGDSAADGTPCNIGTNDMCISGICRKVGCDWVVDSNTTEDLCGVCGGTGENCTTIKGEFNKKMNTSDGYFHILTIPSGSRHIHIEETNTSRNFLSISNANNNETYLNGGRVILMPGEFMIDKIMGLYERENDQEKIKIPGPIPFNISISVLARGKNKGPPIKYEYTLSANSSKAPEFYWKLGDWTACSATCGGGIQRRLPLCYEENKDVVEEENCWSNANNEPPDEKVRVCNEDPCPAHWWIGPWQMCPVTCKQEGQPDPVKRRSIMCVDQNEIALSDSRCNAEQKPDETEICNKNLPICSAEDDNNENSNMI